MVFLTPLEAGSGSVDKDFITIRKLSWIQAHACSTASLGRRLATLPAIIRGHFTTLNNSLLGGEMEPALSFMAEGQWGRCLETNVNVVDRFDFKTALAPGPSHELHE